MFPNQIFAGGTEPAVLPKPQTEPAKLPPAPAPVPDSPVAPEPTPLRDPSENPGREPCVPAVCPLI